MSTPKDSEDDDFTVGWFVAVLIFGLAVCAYLLLCAAHRDTLMEKEYGKQNQSVVIRP